MSRIPAEKRDPREFGPRGINSPRADLPCGAIDPRAKVPERVHYGCAFCTVAIRDILAARAVQGPPAPAAVQLRLPVMDAPSPRRPRTRGTH
jgi:hypothetical protein